ncbi:hypothetical protein MLD38_023458 [Melastoma candidum]|uniref:Uncharacterized protein n=1 Tax=Melastoma candidum TaxID=119954 RepID=A0ACB9NSN2_9MYRT|nr:hypothetical protein MLD38_023458 [Melastoma candidum]
MEADWDLHAVVRGSSSSHAHLPHQPLPPFPPPGSSHLPLDQQSPLLDWQLPFESSRRSSFQEELQDLYKPFFRKPLPLSLQDHHPPLLSSSSSSSLSSTLFHRTKNEPSSLSRSHTPSSVCQSLRPASQSSKSKKRKNTLKKVCEVPAENVSSDVWAWRKYGQKPIKGSPFPRSYYRCSSSKGCLARKQVERNRSDPGMFIVTYTGEHNHPAPTHRNSLAGVSRQKQPSPTSTAMGEITTSESNGQQATSCSSPGEEEKEESAGEQEMEDEWEVLPGDDFFAGLEGLMGWGGGGSGDKEEEQGRWDPCQTCFSFPWTANNTAAAAAGGS